MSGKSKRLARQEMSTSRFPEITETKPPSVFIKAGLTAAPWHPITVNHNRRIASLAKSDGITIQAALQKYVRKVGLMPKPKAQ